MTTKQLIIAIILYVIITGLLIWVNEKRKQKIINDSEKPASMRKYRLLSGSLRAELAGCICLGLLITWFIIYLLKQTLII